MTVTEQILNLLEINENIPSLVINEYANIVASNKIWSDQLNKIESGKNIFTIFDKNTSLLVKSSLIDSKTFLRIKKRVVQLLLGGNYKNYQLIISPFKIENKLYFYIVVFNEDHKGNFIIYPTIDDLSYYNKFTNLFDTINSNQEFSSIESDLKYLIEIGKEPIAIKNFTDFTIMNRSFEEFVNPEIRGLEISLDSKLKNTELLLSINTCVKESIKNKSIFVIENPFTKTVNLTEMNRIVIFPIDKKVEALIFGKLIFEGDITTETTEHKQKPFASKISGSIPTIIYDKNNFEILEVNESAADIYGYQPNEFHSMNFIELFVPDDVQKLLSFDKDEKVLRYKHLKKDGSIINIVAERENISWLSHDAFLEKIRIENQQSSDTTVNSNLIKGEIHPEDDGTKLESVENISINEISEISDEKKPDDKTEQAETGISEESEKVDSLTESPNEKQLLNDSKTESSTNISEEKTSELKTPEENKEIQTEKEEETENVKTELKTPLEEPKKETVISEKPISPFLSSLFHELLTPVNVILGFMQEIIDSVENPTEEQEESAKIIKENQQLLLQTMNTAVQYTKLEERLLPLKIETFDLKNYSVDLEDSIFKTAENENVNVHFAEIDEFIIKNDRQKLLAAVSYFIKFVVKLTKSNVVNISFNRSENHLEVFVKDNDLGISEKVLHEMIGIYNSDKYDENNNLGLSQITIRLSKKLNEIISANVSKHFVENSALLVLSIPLNIEKVSFPKEKSKEIEKDTEGEKREEEEKETIEKISASSTEDEISDKKLEKNNQEILTDDISEKPVEILEEPETLTEIDGKVIEDFNKEEIEFIETTPVEDKESKGFDISELSCLFIDDSVDTQLLFKSQMANFQNLTVCKNFTEAIPILKKNKFDIIYVDINLNDIYNGFDALKIIRQLKDYKTTPVIAVTAYSFEGDKEKFINFGFTDYFVKPLIKKELVESLGKTLF